MSIPQSIKVWCLLIDEQKRPAFGPAFARAFSVVVSSDDTIEDLTIMIKERSRHLASIDPTELCVWKLQKPRPSKEVIRTEFLTTVKLLPEPSKDEDENETARLLEPTDKVSSEGPWPELNLHVLVVVPSDLFGNEPSEPPPKKQKTDGETLADKYGKLPAPSVVAKDFKPYLPTEGSIRPSDVCFLCNRPIDYETIPLPLMHPVFGNFRKDFWTSSPDENDSAATRELTQDMCNVYENEKARQRSFVAWFSKTYKRDMHNKVGPPTSGSRQSPALPETDGHGFTSDGKFVMFITEGKLEAGSGAQYQTMAYWTKLYLASEDMQRHAGYSCLPAILIIYVGTRIEVMGIIAHPDGLVQTELLIPPLGLYCDWRDQRQRDSIARFIRALRNSLDALADYYNELAKRPASPFSLDHFVVRGRKCRTPYPHHYTSVDGGKIVEFKYIKPMFDDRMVFEVEELARSGSRQDLPHGRRVIVKFAQRYGRTAHDVLYREGAAPKLLGFDDLVDDWKMVTMEFLSSEDWVMLENLRKEDRQRYRDKVEEAVLILREAGQVHGDIRGCNILVPSSSNSDKGVVKFLDFDEAGSPEVATYPRYWNADTVKRPNDAREGLPLKYTHDEFMIDQIFEGVAHNSGEGIRSRPWG